MIAAGDVERVVRALLDAECYSATLYVNRKEVIRVTKPRYARRRKQWDKRDRALHLNLTIGAPNYRERQRLARNDVTFGAVYLRDFPKPR